MWMHEPQNNFCPGLQTALIDQMKSSCFSIALQRNNDQHLEKMNPITVCLFKTSQHLKVATKFYNMISSKSLTGVGIFIVTDIAMAKNGTIWDNWVSLAVANTLVNVRRKNSVIAETRKKNNNISLGYLFHMTHNTKSKETKLFVKASNNFNVEVLLVDMFFQFIHQNEKSFCWVLWSL